MIATQPTPRELVERCLEAVARFDYDTARACLADEDFEYTGPINTFRSPNALMSYLELATPIVQRVEIRRTSADGDDVAHFLVVRTHLAEKLAVHAGQWARISAGRIDRIEVVFGAYWYRSLFVAEDDCEPRAVTQLQ
ncbi:MAG: nuclear transport factor 2 family protein [Halofilum sp. (in: g-proteobacteria)]